MGEVDEVLSALQRVAEEGFPCYTWFERDPFLEGVRRDLRFTEVIADMRTRWGAIS